MMGKFVLFTDLDGTLLDEKTYSAEIAIPALKKLLRWEVDIVFCSSKTKREQQVLQKQLGINNSLIVENGSAIIVPPNKIDTGAKFHKDSDGAKSLILGLPLEEIREKLKKIEIQTGFKYQSFGDLTVKEVAQRTNLDLASAKRAKDREFSEVIVSALDENLHSTFFQACKASGLYCARGGRFWSVTGEGSNKGKAVSLLIEQYRRNFDKVISIGIGDSPNDSPMLNVVDFPYLVERPNRKHANIRIENLKRINGVGPVGFAQMVNSLQTLLPE